MKLFKKKLLSSLFIIPFIFLGIVFYYSIQSDIVMSIPLWWLPCIGMVLFVVATFFESRQVNTKLKKKLNGYELAPLLGVRSMDIRSSGDETLRFCSVVFVVVGCLYSQDPFACFLGFWLLVCLVIGQRREITESEYLILDENSMTEEQLTDTIFMAEVMLKTMSANAEIALKAPILVAEGERKRVFEEIVEETAKEMEMKNKK